MQYKTHNKLFNGIYKYKIVVVLAGAGNFRGGDTTAILKKLKSVDIKNDWHIHDNDDLDYAIRLCNTLGMMKDVDIRVESPRISIYTNAMSDIKAVEKLNPLRVKYISKPPDGVTLEPGIIVMPERDYDYRVTVGRSSQVQDAFIEWSDANANKVMLTPGCRKHLSIPNKFGSSYFYIKGEKTLLMAKMHLGQTISRIDKIVKQ